MMSNCKEKMAGIPADFSKFSWINPPANFKIENNNRLLMTTDSETDFWQRTYYGFRNDNGHAFLTESEKDFTFTVKAEFESSSQFDQCGVMVYQDSDNWMKASIELEDNAISRLGSVVTNLGYSDWATTDISSSVDAIWYRVSRRGQDFYIETSADGNLWKQMRVLHLHLPIEKARFGIYACSPSKGAGMKATFSHAKIEPCRWELHL